MISYRLNRKDDLLAGRICHKMISAVENQIMHLLLPLLFLPLKSQLPLIKYSLCCSTVFLLFTHKLIRRLTLLSKPGHKSFLQSTLCLLFTGYDGYNLYIQKLCFCVILCLAIFPTGEK